MRLADGLPCGCQLYFRGMVSSATAPLDRVPAPKCAHRLTLSLSAFDRFFCLGIGIGKLDHFTASALAFDPAHLTPATGPLPLKSALFEDLPDGGIDAHFGQPAVRSLRQSPTPTPKRQVAVASLCRIGFAARPS